MAYKNIDYRKTKELITRIFHAYGFTPADSDIITDILLAADLHGIESHGIQRLIRYHKAISEGVVNVHAEPEKLIETPISAVFDAHGAMGLVIRYAEKKLSIAKANKTGIVIVTVRNSYD